MKTLLIRGWDFGGKIENDVLVNRLAWLKNSDSGVFVSMLSGIFLLKCTEEIVYLPLKHTSHHLACENEHFLCHARMLRLRTDVEVLCKISEQNVCAAL